MHVRNESFYIGEAIEYLEDHLQKDLKVEESQFESVKLIIKNLEQGTLGGRLFCKEREAEAAIAEAWGNLREEYPEFFK